MGRLNFLKKVQTMGLKSVSSDNFINQYSRHLQDLGEIKVPVWTDHIKTAKRNQMPPQDPNWLYTRIASVARQLYIHPKGIGVGSLARFYGSRTRNTTCKKHFSKSSRGVIRYALKVLKKLGFVETVKTSTQKQLRRLTSKGLSDLDNIAANCKQKAIVDENEKESFSNTEI